MTPEHEDYIRGLMWTDHYRETLEEYLKELGSTPDLPPRPKYNTPSKGSTKDLEGDWIGTYGWKYGQDVLEAAYEGGVRWIDTAPTYGFGRTEKALAVFLKEHPDVQVATKIPKNRMTYQNIQNAARQSLERLGREVIDLYQIHWPTPTGGPALSETLGSMVDLKKQGLIRRIGVSNFNTWLLAEAQSLCSEPIVSNQIRFNLQDQSAKDFLLPFCKERGVHVLAYSPLGQDFKAFLKDVPDLAKTSRRLGYPSSAVALGWILTQGVTPLPRTNSPAHVKENLKGRLTVPVVF